MFMQVNPQRGVECLVSREQVPLGLGGAGGGVGRRGSGGGWG